MRIIGGEHRGRKFYPPANIPARPTTDMVKEGLFNTLNNLLDFEGLKTLELFGGTGSISFELASRGASLISLVEKDRRSLNFIRNETQQLGYKDNFRIIGQDVFKFLEQDSEQYDFIFADPPYALTKANDLPVVIFGKKKLFPGGILVFEHTNSNNYEAHPNFLKTKKYGSTLLSYFRENTAPADA